MHPIKFVREALIIAGAVFGAVMGYSFGAQFEHEIQLVSAFAGMSLFGAFFDFCLRSS